MMVRMLVVVGLGLAAAGQPAWAARCQYDRTSTIYGQDSQGHIRAPSGMPCHIFFRSARNRTEWSVVSPPAHGVLTPVGARGWDYVPTRGYGGPDVFTVEVSGEAMGRYVYRGSSKTTFSVDVVP
jgi:hypothetical protein